MSIIDNKVLAISLRGTLLSNNKDRNGDIDFLMESKEKIIKTVTNDDEMNEFKNYLASFPVCEELLYHVDHYVDYLKKEYKYETRPYYENKNITPTSGYQLYMKMAFHGNGIIINPSNIMLLCFMPGVDEITTKQIEALKRLQMVIDDEKTVEGNFVSKSKNSVLTESFDTFDEMVSFIETNRKKLSK